MRIAITHTLRRLARGALILPVLAPLGAGAAERMVAPADLAKFPPSETYRMTEPLPTPVARPAPPPGVDETTEEADPERSPVLRECDLLAADPGDPTRPEAVPGVELAAIDVAAAAPVCERALASQRGHARTAFNLGRVEMARGDIEAAVEAFLVAAGEGHPLAAMTVAQLYQGGVLPDRGPADAVPYYKIAAEAGVAAARLPLAKLLGDGAQGLEPDYAAAARWYREAAADGSAEAAFELGWAFENGLGVPRDPITAARWYKRAIDGGSAEAINNLGFLYANGTGVPRDEARALELYRQAADLGVAAAMANLGWMLENGIGTEQNTYEAIVWYNRAADLGEAQAMLNLGWLYLTGFDVPPDPAAALDWFKRAYAAGRTEALSYIGEVYETDPGLRDPVQAARYYVQALEAGDTWPARRGAREWDPETAREMQNALFAAGVYDGPFDGEMGEATREAMNRLLARSRTGS